MCIRDRYSQVSGSGGDLPGYLSQILSRTIHPQTPVSTHAAAWTRHAGVVRKARIKPVTEHHGAVSHVEQVPGRGAATDVSDLLSQAQQKGHKDHGQVPFKAS